MLLYGILIAVGLSIIAAIWFREGMIFVATFCPCFVIFMGSLLFAIPFCTVEVYETEKTPIVSLRTETGARGSFFLGSGRVGSIPHYYAYREKGEGYQLYKWNAEETILIEDDSVNPHVKIMYRHKNPPWWIFPSWFPERPIDNVHKTYVPENTIVREFNVK